MIRNDSKLAVDVQLSEKSLNKHKNLKGILFQTLKDLFLLILLQSNVWEVQRLLDLNLIHT